MSVGPVLFVSHGAATLGTRRGDALDVALRGAAPLLAGARAVIVVSAHDVRAEITVGVAPEVAMWHDHPAAAGLVWSTPGAADVAARIEERLTRAGLPCQIGEPLLDHGAWIPLRAIDPEGERPVVTLALHAGLAPLSTSRSEPRFVRYGATGSSSSRAEG